MTHPFRLLLFLLPLQITAQNRLMDQPMQIQSCKLTVRANVFYAESVFELTVFNDKSVEAEQVVHFRLQPSQAVTGLDLDLNGHFREGSIEERWKANNAYNSVVGKRVDPAIVQMLTPNQYRLNVYPVPSKGYRRLRLHITQLLPFVDGALWYRMNVPFDNIHDSIHAFIEIHDEKIQAAMGQSLFSGQPFIKMAGMQQMAASSKFDRFNKRIEFSLTPSSQTNWICPGSEQTGRSSFMRFFMPEANARLLDMSRFSVFWDVSGSMQTRKLELELKCIRQLISAYHPAEVEFVLFSNKPLHRLIFSRKENNLDNIIEYLRQYKPSGATCLGNLQLSREDSHPVFLFTDGINSFGKSRPVIKSNVVQSIVSSAGSDTTLLRQISFQTGGRLFTLHENNLETVVSQSAKGNLLWLSDFSSGNKAVHTNHIFEPGQIISFSGRRPQEINLRPVNDNPLNPLRKRDFIQMSCDSEAAQKIRMLMQFDSLDQYDRWTRILAFGLKEKVVTLRTSFIVLERVEDYIQYNIEPPKEMEEACRLKNYVYNKAAKEAMIRQAESSETINLLLREADYYSSWWTKISGMLNQSPVVEAPVAQVNRFASGMMNPALQDNLRLTTIPVNQSEIREMSEVVVTALGIQRQARELGYSTVRINRSELINSNPVYVANALTGKVSGLNVQTVNNGVFSDTRITLRGIRSLTGNNQPMLVVDNLPVDLSLLSVLNPNDISHVTILKSASSTVIYGPDGVNGAILIQTKRGSMRRYTPFEEYKLNDREDEEYIQIMNASVQDDIMRNLREMETEYGNQPVFYFDMAEWFYEKGRKEEAYLMLMQAAEMSTEMNGKLALAYILERWNRFDLAIDTYQQILEKNPRQALVRRDLALAYYQMGDTRSAAETYLSIISQEDEYGTFLPCKLTALQEFNALLVVDPCLADKLEFDRRLIRIEPIDIKADLSGPSSYGNLRITGNGVSEAVAAGHAYTGRRNYYRNVFNPYYFFKAKPGRYTVICDHYYYPDLNIQLVPDIERLVIFRNFQRKNQTLEIRNINLTYQHGSIELDGIDW